VLDQLLLVLVFASLTMQPAAPSMMSVRRRRSLPTHSYALKSSRKKRSQSAVLRRFYEQLQLHGIGSPIENPVRREANSLASR